MQYVNGGISFPTLKIPYQNDRYFCEVLILSLKISKKTPPLTHYTLVFAHSCTIVFHVNFGRGGGRWLRLSEFNLVDLNLFSGLQEPHKITNAPVSRKFHKLPVHLVMAAIQMHYVNGGISFPTLKIPYQNNRYFCEILILSLKNQQEDATTNPLHPQICHSLYNCTSNIL